jgi:prefoldin subunit 5
MGNEQDSESRMDAAIARLEKAATALAEEKKQGEFSSGEDAVGSDLAAENEALKSELEALRAKYDALKKKTQAVSGRLDQSIDQLSLILEQ